MTTHNSIFSSKEEYLAFKATWASVVNSSAQITSIHHVLYNLLRGLPHDRGFTPVTNSNKLANGTMINGELYYACKHLHRWQKEGSFPDYFTRPFGDTITKDMLILIDIPHENPLHSNYGISKHVAESIIDGDFKPTNFTQVYEALEKVA